LLRLLEAVLFATPEPLTEKVLAARLPEDTDLTGLLNELKDYYANRGVNLTRIEDRWAFRTASDLTTRLQIERKVSRKLSRAAIESLAIIAYHQPVTRAEIEEIRGVVISKGTLDLLLEIGWIRPKGRRETPGRPVTWATTESFLEHFGLEGTEALPGVEELRAAGMLDSRSAISTLATQASSAGHLQPDEDAESEEAGVELRGEPQPIEGLDPESVEPTAPVSDEGEPADDDYERELLRQHGIADDESANDEPAGPVGDEPAEEEHAGDEPADEGESSKAAASDETEEPETRALEPDSPEGQ
jgi:segregation and condensation protein B